MAVTIGIDPSINSTGVCVYNNGECYFYIITNHVTKKEANIAASIPLFSYIEYDKIITDDIDNYVNEWRKTTNFIRIVDAIDSIIQKVYSSDPSVTICMEGISYGSSVRTRSIFDLAGLNYMIRQRILEKHKDISLIIATPAEIKKFTTGKGNANKDMMKNNFVMLFPDMKKIPKYDDIADAYFMSQYASQHVLEHVKEN